jgi:hypothetical protein
MVMIIIRVMVVKISGGGDEGGGDGDVIEGGFKM